MAGAWLYEKCCVDLVCPRQRDIVHYREQLMVELGAEAERCSTLRDEKAKQEQEFRALELGHAKLQSENSKVELSTHAHTFSRLFR